MPAQRKPKADPIEDAVSAWLFQHYDERLRKGRPAHEWHGDARGLLAEIRRATKAQETTVTPDAEYRLTLGDLLQMREESRAE